MSAGVFQLLDEAKLKILNNTISLASATFYVALTNTAVSLTHAFTGTSTNGQYSDLAAGEVVGAGYTAGGTIVNSVSLTASAGTVTFSGNAVSWSNATITANNAVLYAHSNSNKDILGFMPLDAGGANVSSTAGTFTVNWGGSGTTIFTDA